MAQRKPEEQATFDQVLKLVEDLTPEAQVELIEQMKLQWLRREVGKAEAELQRGEGIPGEAVFDRLQKKYERMKSEKQEEVLSWYRQFLRSPKNLADSGI